VDDVEPSNDDAVARAVFHDESLTPPLVFPRTLPEPTRRELLRRSVQIQAIAGKHFAVAECRPDRPDAPVLQRHDPGVRPACPQVVSTTPAEARCMLGACIALSGTRPTS